MLPKSAQRGMGLVALGGPSMRLKMFHVKVKKNSEYIVPMHILLSFLRIAVKLYMCVSLSLGAVTSKKIIFGLNTTFKMVSGSFVRSLT